MILRAGELFLRGAAGARDLAAAWDLLTKSIHAIGTFFDRLILDDRLPVFNYADTFDLVQNFNGRALAQVNATEEILFDVDVRHGANHDVKSAALSELRTLYGGAEARVEAQDLRAILGELSASGYAWYPKLDGLVLRDGEEERLAAFILGGLIFGAYAQLAGTSHLMQPKRSRSGEARDYRAWLREALSDFDTNGRIPVARAREGVNIASAIQRRLEGFPLPKLEIKMTVADVASAKPPSIGVDLTSTASATWGWVVAQLPGTRHRKLLSRAIIADREYLALDRRVRTVWSGPGLGG